MDTLENTGSKETCNKCFSIWGWMDTCCPECGSNDIEDYHPIECECEFCKQGVRQDPNIEDSIIIMAETGTLHDFSE